VGSKSGVRKRVRKCGFSLRAPDFEIPEKCKKKREKPNFQKREIPEIPEIFPPGFLASRKPSKMAFFRFLAKRCTITRKPSKTAFFGLFQDFRILAHGFAYVWGGSEGGNLPKWLKTGFFYKRELNGNSFPDWILAILAKKPKKTEFHFVPTGRVIKYPPKSTLGRPRPPRAGRAGAPEWRFHGAVPDRPP